MEDQTCLPVMLDSQYLLIVEFILENWLPLSVSRFSYAAGWSASIPFTTVSSLCLIAHPFLE
ncbi:MAG: hypothetical protein JRN39_06550 [Nitrososphaerota archaeon]|nr:hypothetical protein [Nitrososphaerota archaeon]